jgi:uncharacterized protein
MKIIVTGGTGFIGGALCEPLVREGHEVVVLTRRPRGIPDRGVRFVHWEGTPGGAWESEISGAGAVINFAGEPLDARRWTDRQKDRILQSRIKATIALVETIRKGISKPAVFISASGVGYYGPVDDGRLSEDAPQGSDFLSMVTAQWEAAAQTARENGVRTVILRTAVVLARGGGALRKMLFPFKLFAGGPLGSGRQWFPWVHRDDLVGAIMLALKEPTISGVFNVVAPESVTMKQFCSVLGGTLHRPSWMPVPSFALKLLLGEMSGMVLTGQQAVPARLLEAGYRFKYPDLTSALKDAVG